MNHMSTLKVKVSEKNSNNEKWYEGTVSIAGLKPTKLARKSDGNTKFTSRSAATGAAKKLAESMGYTVDFEEAAQAKKTPAKKAAKKSATAKPSLPGGAATTNTP
jgi:hypothetical protein